MKENFGSLGALAAQFNSEELDKLISLMDADNSGSVMGAERDGWECPRHSAQRLRVARNCARAYGMAGEIDFDEFCMTMSMCIGGGQLTDEEFVDMIFQSACD